MEASTVTEALAGRSEEELREMLARIGRSKGCLEEALVDAEAEQKELQDEKEHLLSTIDFMMKELRKLNISSSNLVEPRLEGEGPVEYVARLWETMRPRELAGPVSENMGGEIEIRKPGERPVLPSFEDSPAAQRLRQQLTEGWTTIQAATKDLIPPGQEGLTPKELGKQVAERGQELKKQISGFFQEPQEGEEEVASTPRMVRETIVKQKQKLGKKVEKLAGALSFLTADDNPGMGSLFAYLRDPTQRPQTGPDSAGPEEPEKQAEPASSSTSAGSSEGKAASVSREPSDDHAAPAPVEEAAAETVAAPAVAPAAPATEAVVEAPAPVVEAKEEEEPAPPASEESTLLISVQLTLGDGSVQVCEVRAADRCKEVASRFVKEHSLKAWFEAPLKKYLMEVEANAETFPVKLEADLMEIREQYKKK